MRLAFTRGTDWFDLVTTLIDLYLEKRCRRVRPSVPVGLHDVVFLVERLASVDIYCTLRFSTLVRCLAVSLFRLLLLLSPLFVLLSRV